MDTRAIEQMVGELTAASKVASAKPAKNAGAVQNAPKVDFAAVLDNAMQDVSAAQKEARGMAKEFSAGDPEVKIQDVMVNLEKASLSFQQMVQVRNKLVSAYQDIMNMPV